MEERARAWFARRTSRWQDWPVDRLLAAKRRLGVTVSVVIPARDEQGTVGGVVRAVSDALVTRVPLVDELVVIDSDSADATADVAAEAGAVVYRAAEIMGSAGSFPGKGEALWKSLLVTKGDLLVFIDADLTRWGPHFVTGLLGPLLADQEVRLVKGFYTRVRAEADGSTSADGGRVTELVARPLISLWWPELAGVVQPLAGEWAARRGLMESLSIPVGYGVEFATLMDTAAGYGLDAVAQVDLGSRAHRHQANHDLALMAAELLLVAERRSPAGPPRAASAGLHQFVRDAGGRAQPVTRPVPVHERPPVASLAERTPVASLTERPSVTPAGGRAATGGADEVSLIVGGFPPTGGRKSASYRTAAGGAEGEGGAEGAGGAGD
jgi:glucosyl-3-phosphoglycerate synthase